MEEIASFVFLDLETTGIPAYEHNKTRITELSMIAVKSEHFSDVNLAGLADVNATVIKKQLPRVQHKLTLCLNPFRIITPDSTAITKLSNELLEREPRFNLEVFRMIDSFITLLEKPVCLVAYNGTRFDYPILKNHLEHLNVTLPEDLFCVDALDAFYFILNNASSSVIESHVEINKILSKPTLEKTMLRQNQKNESEIDSEISQDHNDVLMNTVLETKTRELSMEIVNNTTPTQKKKEVYCSTPKKVPVNRRTAVGARRRLPWSTYEKPKVSYKLEDVYERLLKQKAIGSHRAESDCLLMLECAVVLSKKFIDWANQNKKLFSDIEPMKLGVCL